MLPDVLINANWSLVVSDMSTEGKKETKTKQEAAAPDFFDQLRGQMEELVKEREETERKAAEYLDRLRRLQADMENLQKMTKRQIESITKQASENLILKLLPILDSLGQAEKAARSANELPREEIAVGLNVLLKQFIDALGTEGLKEIPAVGETFDPNNHEAVGFLETDETRENIVVEEVRKGYQLNGKVIRPSLVVVSRRKTALDEKGRED